MLTRALLVLLAMMTGIAAGPAAAASRAPELAVSISIQSGHVDAARAEARAVPHAHLANVAPVAQAPEISCSGCELTVVHTVQRGDRSRE